MTTITIVDHDIPETTHDRYTVELYDNTILTLVTDTPSFVDEWISEIERIHHRRLDNLIVGLDVEWRPSFSKHVRYPVATLQLCVGRRCLIFQIYYSRYIPQSLVDFLSNPNYTFTGVGIHEDIEKLKNDYDLEVENVSDLTTLAVQVYNDRDLYGSGLTKLANWVCGMDIHKPKTITTSHWDKEWLSLAQVKYACVDAFLSFEIGRKLITGDID
uniref:Werner Syndrome-like exonuclease n=1 Tax=Erigeron canadensis TaxID=72917 RepID=UPI001CB93278|nr:Werner Syndrome-like exonuclease [Erigeron canadensis]